MHLKTLDTRFQKAIARQQAEQMVVRMLCGDHLPERTIVGWGDARVTGTKQLRDAAIRAGVLVVPIDEYNTSRLCSGCHGELQSFPCYRRRRAEVSAGMRGTDPTLTSHILRVRAKCPQRTWRDRSY